MSTAKQGDNVKVHYTGRLKDGTQFDSSAGRAPLGFTVGAGQMIKGFDEAVNGMEMNEQITVTIPSSEAYGDKRDDLIQEIPRKQLPEDMQPEVGQKLVATNDLGHQTQVAVTAVSAEAITVDANHELAGKDLVFDIELVAIN